MDASKKLP